MEILATRIQPFFHSWVSNQSKISKLDQNTFEATAMVKIYFVWNVKRSSFIPQISLKCTKLCPSIMDLLIYFWASKSSETIIYNHLLSIEMHLIIFLAPLKIVAKWPSSSIFCLMVVGNFFENVFDRIFRFKNDIFYYGLPKLKMSKFSCFFRWNC